VPDDPAAAHGRRCLANTSHQGRCSNGHEGLNGNPGTKGRAPHPSGPSPTRPGRTGGRDQAQAAGENRGPTESLQDSGHDENQSIRS
jgi:hypothetical protein